jgi:predicted nucleotidyltransferase
MQMKTNDEIIEIIKKTSLDYLPDAEVLLFGSHARKNASLESQSYYDN